jgi:transposase
MADVRVIGLDIAKSVFQVHGVDAAGATVLRKRLTRSRLLPFFEKLPPCLVGSRHAPLRIFGLESS